MRTEVAHRNLVPRIESRAEKLALHVRVALILGLASACFFALVIVPIALIFAPDAVVHFVSKFVSVRTP